jgi:hypothetical protein
MNSIFPVHQKVGMLHLPHKADQMGEEEVTRRLFFYHKFNCDFENYINFRKIREGNRRRMSQSKKKFLYPHSLGKIKSL